MSQDAVFTATEGNRYWQRNRTHMAACPPDDTCLRLLAMYHIYPQSILEVGASNGYRMHEAHMRYGCRAVAVEPSTEAIADGQTRFPAVEFYQGTAAQVPLQEQFDVVVCNFVLHWVDRANLLRSVAELDRLLVDGGFLLLGDFAPVGFVRTPYHHTPEMWTFKQDYAAVFMASGLYHPVAMLTGAHGGVWSGSVGETDRVGTWLLQKCTHAHYTERRLGT